jgi:uncharacterized protein (TIGR02466 family)
MNKDLLFSTEFYFFNNENIDNDKIKEVILEKEKTETSRELSNKGGWQSQDSLLEEKDFFEIKDFLFECTESITKDIYEDDIKFSMVGTWANVNRKGAYNETHLHGNSHWSCVYYVTETYEASIYFIDPRVRAGMFTTIHSKKNKYSNILERIKCEPGQALFFPSWLEHGVKQNLTDNPRISISCNFIVTGN